MKPLKEVARASGVQRKGPCSRAWRADEQNNFVLVQEEGDAFATTFHKYITETNMKTAIQSCT